MGNKTSMLGTIGALWGLVGVLLLLTSATLRLTPLALDAFSYQFSWRVTLKPNNSR